MVLYLKPPVHMYPILYPIWRTQVNLRQIFVWIEIRPHTYAQYLQGEATMAASDCGGIADGGVYGQPSIKSPS